MTLDPKLAATLLALSGMLLQVFGGRRRSHGLRQLLTRYQSRAHRSVPLSELDPRPWADRPYLVLRPEDVLT